MTLTKARTIVSGLKTTTTTTTVEERLTPSPEDRYHCVFFTDEELEEQQRRVEIKSQINNNNDKDKPQLCVRPRTKTILITRRAPKKIPMRNLKNVESTRPLPIKKDNNNNLI